MREESTLKTKIEELNKKIKAQSIKNIEDYPLDRIATRLDSFSGDCTECAQLSSELEKQLDKLLSVAGTPEKADVKDYQKCIKSIFNHLKKAHKLSQKSDFVVAGLIIGVSIGIALGLAFGLSLGSVALGLPIGLGSGFAIGIAIGAGMEEDAKKKGTIV